MKLITDKSKFEQKNCAKAKKIKFLKKLEEFQEENRYYIIESS
jgi:hypothetical protein